jgi:hypothetical protein
MCDCIERIQSALIADATKNTALDVPITIDWATGTYSGRAKISTCKRDTTNRKKALPMIAVFCPFCGEKYPPINNPKEAQ